MLKRSLLAGAALLALAPMARAYTAAGDRVFPATLILPQAAPSDELYLTPATLPQGGGVRANTVGINYTKTITERLGIGIGDGFNWLDGPSGTRYGWQNLTTSIQYLAVRDADHEFLLSVGGEREWGATGAQSAGANHIGATQPAIYFAKGLGDVAAPWLRPFAIAGVMNYSKSDGAPRPDLFGGGLAIEYSIPYLELKVRDVALPEFVRQLTPILEFQTETPANRTHGANTTNLIAPGVVYAGQGWEFGIEGQIPTTRATGHGVGVIAQIHFSLDYFMPETIGRPIFSGL